MRLFSYSKLRKGWCSNKPKSAILNLRISPVESSMLHNYVLKSKTTSIEKETQAFLQGANTSSSKSKDMTLVNSSRSQVLYRENEQAEHCSLMQ